MKFLFFTSTLILLSQILLSKDYELTVMSIHETKTMNTKSNYKFSISEAEGNWQDSLGNYGKLRIIFYVESDNIEKAYLKGLGRLSDQNNEYAMFAPLRKSQEEAGVGIMKFLEASEKYLFLTRSKCTYAINYFENRSFIKVKCK